MCEDYLANEFIAGGWKMKPLHRMMMLSSTYRQASKSPRESAYAAKDAENLYSTLENEIIPAYYARAENGLPVEWIARMKNSIATLTPQFSSDRMVWDYLNNIYDGD